MKRRICVVTGTRAEFGHLHSLIDEVMSHPAFELQLIVTGSHLAPEFGMTVTEIEGLGIPIAERIEILVSGDTPTAIGQSMALATIGFVNAFARLKPDLVIVLGDRYELLACAQACLVSCIPVGHIAGGDTTEGAIDESIRHAITKLSHLHFATNSQSCQRIIQMGEDPRHVFNVGAPSLDLIKRQKLLDYSEWQASLNFRPQKKNVLVTFHPVTLEPGQSETQFGELLSALDSFGDELGIIITKANADAEGRRLNALLDRYSSGRSNVSVHTSLGQLRYLSSIQYVDAVVGNSSSGIYEAPFFNKPTVNIGDRQKGRLAASSVIHCEPTKDAIFQSITSALKGDFSSIYNPYGGGDCAKKITSAFQQIPDFKALLKKHFFVLEKKS